MWWDLVHGMDLSCLWHLENSLELHFHQYFPYENMNLPPHIAHLPCAREACSQERGAGEAGEGQPTPPS